jgi:hypothetical protein
MAAPHTISQRFIVEVFAMASYITDFLVFLEALFTTWANLWTGGVILAAVGLYHLIKAKTPTPKTYKTLAILFLIVACFNTWRDEYKKTHPALHLSLEEYGFSEKVTADKPQGEVPLINAPGTAAVVIATVRNLGIPSIADGWALAITVPGRKETLRPRIFDFNLPNQPPIHMDGDTIPLSKLLYKQMLVPIATGDKKQGLLAFFVDGVTREELAQKGTTFTLTCQDIAGNTIKSDTVEFTGKNEGHQHLIGLE